MLEVKDHIDFIDDSLVKKPLEIDDLHGKSAEGVQMEGAVHKIINLGNIAFIIIRTVRDVMSMEVGFL